MVFQARFDRLAELFAQNSEGLLAFEGQEPRIIPVEGNIPQQTRGPGKILVTGGAGYIGSHTVELLQQAGHEVVVLDNLSSGNADAVQCELVAGDLADTELLEKIFNEHQIDAVIHFAGFIIVEESVEHPEKYFQNNVVNGVNLINAMVRSGVKKIIFSSSAAVYGEPEYVPLDEGHRTLPTNPYGETKLLVEKILEWYARTHGLIAVSLRYFNACGADPAGRLGERRPFVTHLIPKILRVAAQQDEALKIFGTDYPTPDGTAVRDYIHVTDLAAAHLLALKQLKQSPGHFVFNVGTGQGFSVKQMVDAVMEITGKMVMIEPSPRRAGDPAILVANPQKIRQELEFGPKFSDLNSIVSTAWKWHQKINNMV